MKKTVFNLLMASALYFHQSYGEVEKIVLKWQSGICLDQCHEEIVKQLERVDQIVEIRIDGNSATLRWRPTSKFSYDPIDTAMRLVGVNIDQIYLTVRGVVRSTPQAIYLESLGNETEFQLLGPLLIEPNRAPGRGNIEGHPLSEQTKKELLQAEKLHQVVTVQGPLFQPERKPALNLVIERLSAPQAL